MFFKIGVHRKAPVLESLFSNAAVLRSATLSKKDSNAGVFE